MTGALETLADWAVRTPREDLRSGYLSARRSAIDTLSCIVAGHDKPAVLKSLAAVASWGEGASSIVGQPLGRPAPWAALVNGTASHALDLDDYNDFPSFGHPSAAIWPALLALGEERRLSGTALLDAFIVGVEVLMRIGEAVNDVHYNLGWHASVTLGTIGAAAGCGRLLGLDVEKMAVAMSIATSCAAGYNSQFGTMTKPLHIGLAGHHGILAAQLAAVGMTASKTTLDGDQSLLTLLATTDAPGFATPLSKLGRVLAIEEYGLSVKRHPCCSATHRVIDGAIALRDAHAFSPEDIAKVSVRIRPSYLKILPFVRPRTGSEAQFSMPYCVAVVLTRGRIDLQDFTESALQDPQVAALIPRIDVDGYDTALASIDISERDAIPDTLRIELDDGRCFEQKVKAAIGMPERPIGEKGLRAKWEGCVQDFLSKELRERLWQELLDFDRIEDTGRLMQHFRSATLEEKQ